MAGRALHHTQHNMLPQPTSNNHLLSFESIYKVQTFKQQLSVLIDVVNVVRPSAAGGRTHDVGGEERSQSTDATWDCYRMGQCSGCAHWAHPAMYILNLHPTISFHQSVSLIIAVCFDDQIIYLDSVVWCQCPCLPRVQCVVAAGLSTRSVGYHHRSVDVDI